MKITALVLDDDPSYCDLIASYVNAHENLRLIGAFEDPEEAKKCIEANEIELCFFDMEMPGMSGLELVRSLTDPPYVIFITSYKDFAIESYEVEAIDYLVKPVKKDRFNQAVDKALERIRMEQKAATAEELEAIKTGDDHFFIRTDAQYVKIRFDDVLYIEALKDFVKIHTPSQVYTALINLKNIELALPKSLFIRTHRSFLVNVRHIAAIGKYDLQVGNQTIPLAQSYSDEVVERVVGKKLIKR
jgi:two-component system, LytTR family, response regulator